MDSESTLRNLEQPAHGVASPFEVGQVLDGKYEIISLLGKGGMGAVYRIRHQLLNIDLALKTLDTARLGDVTSSRRFQTEAKAAFSLKHPNLVKVHDYGVLEDGHPFLVMDLVQGKTLQALIREKGQLDLDEVAAIFPQLCFGLAHAHAQQVVHRDIKPANIMLVDGMSHKEEGSVKILDFGIAKFVNADRGEMQTLTQTGEVFGSPLYMSPEQCSGGAIDQRSDVYSLGCVLFEALTGTPPHAGSNVLRTMMQHVNDDAPTLKEATLGKEFPQKLEEIVGQMLARSPGDRYSDLSLVAHELFKTCSQDKKTDESNMQEIASSKTIASPYRPSGKISLGYLQFAALIVATIAASSASTLLFDHLFRTHAPASETGPVVPKKEIEAENKTSLFDKFSTESIEKWNTNAKVAFERALPIRATRENNNSIKIVFPDLPIGRVMFFRTRTEFREAKGEVYVPNLPLCLDVSATANLPALSNASIYKKIDPLLFLSLNYEGPDKNNEFFDGPDRRELLKQAIKGEREMFAAVAGWKKLTLLNTTDAAFESPTMDLIDTIEKLEHFKVTRCDAPDNVWKNRKFFQRVKAFGFVKCAASKTLFEEVAKSTSIHAVLFGGKASVKDIEALRKCKNLRLFTFVGERPKPELVTAVSQLKQLEEIRYNARYLSDYQLKDLSKDWLQYSPPGMPETTHCLKRRS